LKTRNEKMAKKNEKGNGHKERRVRRNKKERMKKPSPKRESLRKFFGKKEIDERAKKSWNENQKTNFSYSNKENCKGK
jgi:hypothetical protein